MRYIFVIAFFLFAVVAQAQDAAMQQVNQAIDAAERLCLAGSRFKFQLDASGDLNIMKLTPGVEGKVLVDKAEARGSQFFDDEQVRRLVDQDIRVCMQGQWSAVLEALKQSSAQPTIRKVVCTGQHEGNCAGLHDMFYTCGYVPDLGANICGSRPFTQQTINVKGGNKCGYALIEVTCN